MEALNKLLTAFGYQQSKLNITVQETLPIPEPIKEEIKPPFGLRDGLRVWTQAEDNFVLEVVQGHKTALEVSKLINRTLPAVYARVSGVRCKIKRRKESVEREALKSGYY